jgi:hypothetical protein
MMKFTVEDLISFLSDFPQDEEITFSIEGIGEFLFSEEVIKTPNRIQLRLEKCSTLPETNTNNSPILDYDDGLGDLS